MAVITELARPVVQRVLQDYDVGSLVDFRAAQDGIENTNYFVKTSRSEVSDSRESEYVLTLIEDQNGYDQDRSFVVALLDRCYDYGLPVAPIIRTRGGESQPRINDKPILLSPKLQGQHVALPVHDHCGAIGRFLARLHLATETLDGSQNAYNRDAAWINENAAEVRPFLGYNDRSLLDSSVRMVNSLLERSDVQALPQGIIHADLFRDNALFNQYGLSGVVDFHHAGRGFWIYDLAVTLNDWCRTGEKMDEPRVYTLMREYHAIRPIQQEELWFFPSFLEYAALAFWLSRLMVAVRTDLPKGYPVKDPDEFAQLVQRHRSRPFRMHEVVLESL